MNVATINLKLFFFPRQFIFPGSLPFFRIFNKIPVLFQDWKNCCHFSRFPGAVGILVMICTKYIFSHLKQHNFINGTQNMQFYNVICYFLWYLPYFLYPICEFKFNVLVFLNMAPPSNIDLGPGATIRNNTVYLLCLWLHCFYSIDLNHKNMTIKANCVKLGHSIFGWIISILLHPHNYSFSNTK